MAFAPVDVVGMGAVAWDHFLVVPRFPEPDDKVRAIAEYECAGGNIATCLVALRRWGLKCRVASMLGVDATSNRIFDDLQNEGVLTDALMRHEDADGKRSTIIVDHRNGNRSVVSSPHRAPPLGVDKLNPAWFEGARVLHMDSSADDCAIEAATAARELGLKVTIDCERNTPRTAEILRNCDYVIVPMSFAGPYTQQDKLGLAAYALHLQTERAVVVTDGANGCEYCCGDIAFHQPAFPVPVVDCTGAGDIFHAAFIYGLLSAWDIRKTVRFAAWTAAHACKELGGRKGIPTADEIHEYLHGDSNAP